MCKKLRLPADGTKEELIKRLKAYDARTASGAGNTGWPRPISNDSIKMKVTGKREEALKHRKDKDIHTLKTRAELDDEPTDVDHVVEGQVHKDVS